jgi:hypothetical protein
LIVAIELRFGDYIQEALVQQNEVSYNELVPAVECDEAGNELPYVPPRIQLQAFDAYRLIMPYTSVRIMEQVKAVVPLALYLVLFQILILRQDVTDSGIITVGLAAVIVGLMLFMEGLKVGLMPLGELLGSSLPVKYTAGGADGDPVTRNRCYVCRTGDWCLESSRADSRRHAGTLSVYPSERAPAETGGHPLRHYAVCCWHDHLQSWPGFLASVQPSQSPR